MNSFFEELESYFERKVKENPESDKLLLLVTKFENLLEKLIEDFFYK